jgi:uncharacterized protein (TIGR02453 family)
VADVSVRPARPADAERVARVQLSTWRTAYADLLPAEALDVPEVQAAALWLGAVESPPSPRHRLLVALERDELVGFAASGPATDEGVDDATTAELLTVLVEPRWGRRGHGSGCSPRPSSTGGQRTSPPPVAWAFERDAATRGFLVGSGWEPDGAARGLDTGPRVVRPAAAAHRPARGGMSFAGFPEAALDFYEGLLADNSKAYWADHKAVYESAVRAPMQALLDELGPEFGEAKLFRPYRDVRFSKDKTPYKTAAAAAIGDDVQGGLYLQLSVEGLMVAGGAHGMATDQARRLRAAAAEDLPGTTLVALLDRLREQGFTVEGERLKRVPAEFGADHPRADLLTLKTLWAARTVPPDEQLHAPALRDAVARWWRQLQPLNDWIAQHVGPSRVERSRR